MNRTERIAKNYNAEIIETKEDSSFTLRRNFNVDEYVEYAELKEEHWIDPSAADHCNVLCNAGYHVVSIVEFNAAEEPVFAQYYYSDGTGNASASDDDDPEGVLELWLKD